MDFFNSLGEVAKNRHNFKKWEEQQHHNQAQREELAKRRQHTEAELKQAKELGETIIDVVDIMDNHSENVAENVETAVDPLSAFATLTTLIGGTWFVGKHSTAKLGNKIGETYKEYRHSEKGKDLKNRVKEYYKNVKGKEIDCIDLTSKSEINRIKDPALKKELRNYANEISKKTNPLLKKIFRNHGLVVLASIGAFVVSTIFEAKLQTDSSKIARYQARKELEDAKSFVNYTPEQIAAAKKEMAEHPELLKKEKKSKLKSGMFRSIYGIIKDRRAYKRDKSAMTDDSQKVTRELTAEEIKNAKKDKEVIQRTVRLINNEAEKYSENMEVAANVIMGATPVLGATIGAGTGWILNKTGVFDRFINKTLEKYGTEETKTLFNELKGSKKSFFPYMAQWGEFAYSLVQSKKVKEGVEAVGETVKEGVKTVSKNKLTFGEISSKLFTAGFANKWGKSGILALFGGVVTGFAGMIIGLKLQKSAARAGRYTAKRELEKNPQNFIGYTEEDYNEVKHIKNNEKKPNKFKEYALFIPNVMKQYWAYNKYKKTEYKEKQVLKDLLKKQEVTNTQLRDAKNLQRKVFNTFEKVDDNSQVYSESMEAATEIAQPFVWYGGLALAASPFIATGVQVARGKLSVAKVIEKTVNKLSSGSNIMKKKWFKKYLNSVSKNVTNKVNDVDLKETHWIDGKSVKLEPKPLKAVLNGVDYKNDAVVDIIGKIFKNIDSKIGSIRNMNDREQVSKLFIIRDRVLKLTESNPAFTKAQKEAVEDFFEVMINGCKKGDWSNSISINAKTRADAIDLIINPKNLNEVDAENAYKVLEKAFGEEIAGTIYMFSPYVHNFMDFAKNADFTPFIKEMEDLIGKNSAADFVPLNRKMIKYLQKFLGKEKFESCLSKNSLDNINDFMSPKVGMVKPEEIPTLAGIEINDANKLLKETIDKAKKATIKDAFDMLPSRYTNPKEALSNLKTTVDNMSVEEFEDFAFDVLHIKSMDKKTFQSILAKSEKILDNMPKEELDKIWSQIVKEFQEHPDEFIKLVQSGKIKSIFVTPGLKNALLAAGVSWTAFSFAMTYVVEAWMADMQLKAGRLGVMKAMEALDDPAYYANIEPTETADKPQNQTPVKPQANLANANSASLLAKFKQVS